MEGSMLHGKTSSLIFLSPYSKCIPKRKILQSRPVLSMSSTKTEPQKTMYRDTWLDVLAINHFSHNLQAAAGIKTQKKGYEGMLEACKEVTTKFNSTQQRRVVLESLERAIPMHIFPLKLFKALLPNTRFVRQVFATITALFCVWLVGPIEVKESEFEGRREKNVSFIKKCRFLESSNCVGMCTNLCKFPTQKFIKDSMGMPVTLVPNFEDMSCEIIFGAEPPGPEEDEATRQPCYKLCKHKIGNSHTTESCPI